MDGASERMYRGGGEGICLELPRGRDRVDLTGANAFGSTQVEVDKPGGPSTLVKIDIGRLDLSLVAGSGLKLTDLDLGQTLTWIITPLERQRPVDAPTGATPSLALAPGRYRIAASVDGHTAQAEIRVGDQLAPNRRREHSTHPETRGDSQRRHTPVANSATELRTASAPQLDIAYLSRPRPCYSRKEGILEP